MADEWKVPPALAPVRTLALLAPLLLVPSLALFLVPCVVAQNATARKDFVRILGQSIVLRKKGNELVPTYKLTVEGRNSTSFVYHASLMNPSICRSMLTEGVVAKFKALGFTKLVCTDDAEDTYTFDPVIQAVSPAIARKDYVEMVRRLVIRQLGTDAPLGYSLSVDGPDATSYVHHQSAVNLADCNHLLNNRFISGLRGHGFVRLICTDDRSRAFTYDLSSEPRATAFALLEHPE